METDKLCRTCLDSENVMQPLFKSGKPRLMPAANVSFIDLIKSMSEINISGDDGLPLQICTLCIKELQQSHAFKLKCKKSEEILLKLKEAKLLSQELNRSKSKENEKSFEAFSQPLANKRSFLDGEIIDVDDDDEEEEQLIKEDDQEDEFEIAEINQMDEDMDEEMIARLTSSECNVSDDDGLSEIANFEFPERVQESKKLNENKIKITKPKENTNDLKFLKTYKINEKNMKCSACSELFDDLDSLRKHLIESHTKDEFCFLCDSVSGMATTDIWKHCIEHLPKRYACPACGKCFIKRTYLRAHFKLTHSESHREIFPCNLCSKSFKTRSGIGYHRQVTHGVEKHFCCEICDARFAHIKLLRLHMLSYHTDGPPKCKFCGQVFNAHSTMMKHVRRNHKGLNKMRVMGTDPNSFKCAICAKSFTEKELLEAHVIGTHTNFRKFKCTHCPFTFKYKSVMAIHLSIEHPKVAFKEKIEQCEICYQSVSSLKNLNSHMESIHTGIRPYLCVFCSYSFKIESNLENHISTIHANKADVIEYKCDECESTFNNRDHLFEHKSNNHHSHEQTPFSRNASFDATNFIFRTMFQ